MALTTNNYGFPYPQDTDPVDFAGDIQSLAEDIDNNLGEIIADTVGDMVNENTENGISVTYDDTSNILNFDVQDFNITLVGDASGSTTIQNLSSASVTVVIQDDSHNHTSSTITDFAEAVADTVGNMVTSNIENGISVTYDDVDNTLDFDINNFDVVLSGDVSGSATVTNLASINISTSIADNSHNHVASNITDFETAVEAVTEAFVTIDLPSGTDPVATVYNDTLTISESNGILVSGSGSNTIDISTNATPLNTASALVSRDTDSTFDISGINFDVSASPSAVSPGTLYWNSEENTLDLGMSDDVLHSIGMKLFMPPTKNNSGVDIPKGSFVMATGAQGERITIAKAVTDGSVDPEYMIGFAAQNIENGSETGLVVINGTITNVNTQGWPVGTTLYPNSASAGTLSASAGEAPDIRTPVAIVLREHQNSGRIYARMINSHKFGEEADVKLTSLSNGDIAIYNSASSLWMNESFDERAQDAIATMISNGTQTNLTIDYDDNANSLSFNVVGAVADVQGTTNEVEVTSASNIYTVGLPDDVTISNDLTVVGNLTVSGSVTYVNTTELLIEDNIVTLNSSASAPLLDAGIEVQRGSASNVYIKWNETSDVWQFTNDGSTYYDLVDFDTTFSAKKTDDLAEGITNLYFTDQRALNATAGVIASASAAAVAHADALETDDVAEGITNLYFTDQRALDATAGVIASASAAAVAHADALETDDVAEGITNLYFTDQRALDATAGVIASASAAAVAHADALETDDISEGSTNLYFTNERAQDAAAEMIVNGNHTNISVTYNDSTNTLDIVGSSSGSVTSLTDEEIQDAIAPLFTHSNHTNIVATYDDANNEILLEASGAGGGGASLTSGSAYPTSSITNGDLFYNTTNGRTAIYFDSIWKEFAYVTDGSFDGGSASTVSFDQVYEGGSPSTSVFVGSLDNGSV